MRILILGDTHGDLDNTIAVLDQHQNGFDVCVQLGDWAFIWGGKANTKALSSFLKKIDKEMYFLTGNHEYFPMLPAEDGEKPTRVASQIFHLPRGYAWEWEGRSFLALGGAISMDRGLRRLGRDYFHEEAITDEDVERAVAQGRVDIMFTHDAPDNAVLQGFLDTFDVSVFGAGGLSAEFDSMANRRRITKVWGRCAPKYLFHGHLHFRYNFVAAGDYEVIGLGHSNQGEDFWVILDTETMEFGNG